MNHSLCINNVEDHLYRYGVVKTILVASEIGKDMSGCALCNSIRQGGKT